MGAGAEEEKELLEVYHGDKEDATPSEATRKCTDLFCVAIFAAAVAGFGILMASGGGTLQEPTCPSGNTPDIAHLTSFKNYKGERCGEDGRGGLLFFCNVSGTLDVNHQICVSSCPTTSSGTLEGAETCQSTGLPPVNYPTYDLAGIACIPSDLRGAADAAQASLVLRMIFSPDDPVSQFAVRVFEVVGQWQLLVAIAVLDVVLAFVFLRFVEFCAKPIIYFGLATLIVVPGALGGYLVYVSQNGGVDGIPSTGDAQYDLIAGGVFCSISFVIACIGCCMHSSINATSENISAACQCLADNNTLLLEPFISVLGKLIVFVPCCVLFVMLVSCGKVEPSVDHGLFKFEDKDKIAIAAIVFLCIWMLETTTALSQYAVAYAVETWFFEVRVEGTPRCCTSWCEILRGYGAGFLYHLGTFLYGAFILSVFRFVRMALEFMIQTDASGNRVVRCLGRCCECIIGCFEKFIEFLNKNAYMDVAMNGNSFCEAAKHAMKVLAYKGNAAATATLVATVTFLQFCGLGGIAAGSAGIVWVVCKEVPMFADPTSPNYVQDPVLIAGAAAAVGFLVALPFIHLLDIVALSVNYCTAYRKFRLELSSANQPKGCMPSCFFCPSALNRSPKPER